MTVGKNGEYTIVCGGMSGLRLTVRWAEQTDATANTSVLSVTGLSLTADSRLGRYTLNGTIAVNGSVILRAEGDSLWADVASVGAQAEESEGQYPYSSGVIAHGTDGSSSAVIAVNLTGAHGDSGLHYYASAQFTVELTSFAQVSAVTAASGEIGSAIAIGITAADSGSVHDLRYVCGEVSGCIGNGLAGGSHSWTVPISLCEAIPDSQEGSCCILCDTYRNGMLMGTSECLVTLRVPSGVGLLTEDGWLRFVPHNSGTAAEALDCFVQGMSRVQAVFDPSLISRVGAGGAEVVSYALRVGGVNYEEPYLSHVLHDAGTITAQGSVTDTRGRRITEGHRLEVLPYGAPVIREASAFRCNADGSPKEDGSCVSVTAACHAYALGGRNSAELTARLRSVGGQWGDSVPIPNGEAAVLWAGQLQAEHSYEVAFCAADTLGATSELTLMIPTAKVFFHGRAGGGGAAFGKYAEEDNLLELAWDLKTKGNLTVEGSALIGGKTLEERMYPVGSVCTCAADCSPAALFGGVWVPAEDTVCRWVRTE